MPINTFCLDLRGLADRCNLYRDVPLRCWDLYEFLYQNGGLSDWGTDFESLMHRQFSDDEISVASRAFLNPEWDPDGPENGPRTVHLIEFGIEDEGTHKVDWKYFDPKQLPYRPGYQRTRLTKYGAKALEWRRVCDKVDYDAHPDMCLRPSQPSPSYTSMMPDRMLIPIWVEIYQITNRLARWGTSPCFVPGVGDVLVTDYSAEALLPLRAIFVVHGLRIEPELPEDLRNKSWVDLLDPVHVRIKDRPTFFVARMRVELIRRLREAALFIIEKHRLSALVDKQVDAEDPSAESERGGDVPGDIASSKQDKEASDEIEGDFRDSAAVDFPNPSAPLSKKNAADAWGGDMTVKKLTQLMKGGKVRHRELNRETFIFCRDDAPNLPER